MGHYSTFEGEVIITPFLTDEDLGKIYELIGGSTWWNYCPFTFGPGRFFADGDEGKYYRWRKQLESIIEFLTAQHYNLNGYIRRKGEESGDMELVLIENNTITFFEPRIQWVSGTRVEEDKW